MELAKVHSVYFIGIGGIGMSALARWFSHSGKKIAGYDKTETPLTKKLIAEGIAIHYDDDKGLIPGFILNDRENVLVIYTPAIPSDHKELNYLREQGFILKKRAEVLGMISANKYTVAVAGTHGKTTTSSMIAHMLYHAGRSCVGFVGGILKGYENNLIMKGEAGQDTVVVVEADEFDRSFLRLSPNLAVITSVDADHLDIYGDRSLLLQSFNDFVHKIKAEGKLFVHEGIESAISKPSGISAEKYGIGCIQNGAFQVKTKDRRTYFTYEKEDIVIEDIKLEIPGVHNVENAVAAISVGLHLGLKEQEIKDGIESYVGVKRRFDIQIESDDMVYIDDYAHHPVEISSLLKSIRMLYPEKKVTIVFQPHLFSRTRDFADEFAESLAAADKIFLLNIYPAREKPIEGVHSTMLLNKIGKTKCSLIEDNDLLDVLREESLEILLTVGAGDIDRFVEPIKTMFQNEMAK